jgi:hypothetical protein
MASSSPAFEWECGACSAPNKGGKYCIICAAPRTKRQAVAAATAPDMAAASACAPSPSRHPSGIILDVVGTACTNRGCSCEEHSCCGDVLENDALIKLRHEQNLVLDAIAGGGKMKEETAITINWVSNRIDCCRVGFLPRAFVMQGSLWDGILCQVVEVFGKDDPSKLCCAKWHQNKGFARIAVIGTLQVPLGTGNFPGKKDKGVKGLDKKEG